MLPHLRDWRVDTVLILSGDHLYRMDYRKFLKRHVETKADLTISVVPCREDEASQFGLLKTNAKGCIVQFKEKPEGSELEEMRVEGGRSAGKGEDACSRPFLASMGIYVFNYSKLVELLKTDHSWVDFGGEIIPAAIEKFNVQAYTFKGYWEDIGTIRAFYEANLDLASPLPKFNFFDASAPIFTRSRYLPPSKLSGCDIDNSMVSEGCILNGVHMRRSIVGLRSRIDGGVRIEDSIIMGSDLYESLVEIQGNRSRNEPNIGIGENTIIRRSIIDKNVRIGKNVKLINQGNAENHDAEDGSYFIRDGIIIIPKNAVIADGTVV
jgi:glucose-1-phosphate adenylyltransferase